MSIAADMLFPQVVDGIRNISGRLDFLSISDTLTAPTSAYDLNFDHSARTIIIDFRDQDLIAAKLASDCCRLASASFQTISSVQTEFLERDNVAWGLVKLYYSAFYAGNAIIKLFGESCSFFDRHHIDRLQEMSDALGLLPPFRLEAGLYHCAVDEHMTAFRCLRVRAGAGGAHESFWLVFGRCIERLAETILRDFPSQTEPQAVFLQLEKLQDMTRRRAGFSWLSAIRNDLQYRHQYGVWFPAKIKPHDRNILQRSALAWKSDPMSIGLDMDGHGTLREFTSACVFIVSLCHCVLLRIAERSSSGPKSFVYHGPMAFLNDTKRRNAMPRVTI